MTTILYRNINKSSRGTGRWPLPTYNYIFHSLTSSETAIIEIVMLHIDLPRTLLSILQNIRRDITFPLTWNFHKVNLNLTLKKKHLYFRNSKQHYIVRDVFWIRHHLSVDSSEFCYITENLHIICFWFKNQKSLMSVGDENTQSATSTFNITYKVPPALKFSILADN